MTWHDALLPSAGPSVQAAPDEKAPSPPVEKRTSPWGALAGPTSPKGSSTVAVQVVLSLRETTGGWQASFVMVPRRITSSDVLPELGSRPRSPGKRAVRTEDPRI